MGNLRSKEFSARIHFYLSKFRNTKEYAENIENGFQQFEEAKDAFNQAFRVFSGEAKKLALIRQKPDDINMSKYTFHNDIPGSRPPGWWILLMIHAPLMNISSVRT